ncbi:hypothetical protein VE03_04061 [Pseudogymnoascus sp. 23342-1-I1]|nr:hypothetical protein VE03_04061 [Pseudogymnoascus sp. 23342-1-I1]
MKHIISLAALVASAVAHSTFQQIWVDGVDQEGTCIRTPPSNSPVTSATSNDITCNVGGATGVAGLCSVAAGQTVTVEMHAQPGDRSCSSEAIGGNHYGPVIIYMGKVTDAKSADGSGAIWFKVDEEGYDVSTKTWGTMTLNDNCGKRTFTVPSSLAPGNYLLRAEVIALHAAASSGGAQFYMSCYQLEVTGSGTSNPSGVSFPGAYSASDPGILININQDLASYTIPGPTDVFTG